MGKLCAGGKKVVLQALDGRVLCVLDAEEMQDSGLYSKEQAKLGGGTVILELLEIWYNFSSNVRGDYGTDALVMQGFSLQVQILI